MSRSQALVEAFWLGRRSYREIWALQRALVEEILAGSRQSTLLLLEHPHVYTMGRRGVEEHLLWGAEDRARRGVEVVSCDRGGDVTYHGPGQLVGYPLLDLPALRSDIMLHLRAMERSLIAYLGALGIEAEPGGKGLTGVWSAGGKVAAIGVKLNERRVTSHGFALNLCPDLEYFQGIVPCGLVGREVTSVERLTGAAVSPQTAALGLAPHLAEAYGVEMSWSDPAVLDGIAASAPPEPGLPTSLVMSSQFL